MGTIVDTMKIAICGKMCSGKTTLANTIKIMDPRYEIMSLGQGIKDIATKYFGMTHKDRDLLIQIGTKMREINPDVWTTHICKQSRGLSHVIVDDVRYQNEYELLRKQGFVFIQLHVSRAMQEFRIRKLYTTNAQEHLDKLTHESEQNTFEWAPNHEPVLTIDNSESANRVMQRIHSFLQKNENERVDYILGDEI
jgi:hypothetical protein